MQLFQNMLQTRQLSKKGIALSVSLLISLNLSACFEDKTANNTQKSHDNNLTNNTNYPQKYTVDKNKSSATNFAKSNQSNDKNCHNDIIYAKYQQRNPNGKTQVLGCGEVIKVLKDDNDGTRHQKFLVKIDNYPQITVLIAHNIDLAGRINNIETHTPIRFYGEYIYNDKGGVVHWTHKDPAARHQDGWLEYQEQKYW